MASGEPQLEESSTPHGSLPDDLRAPLTTISTRMELLQKITLVTPGLTELERAALLEGIETAQAAAEQLGKHLESLLTGGTLPAATTLLTSAPVSAPSKAS